MPTKTLYVLTLSEKFHVWPKSVAGAVVNISRYREQKTMAYNTCVMRETPGIRVSQIGKEPGFVYLQRWSFGVSPISR